MCEIPHAYLVIQFDIPGVKDDDDMQIVRVNAMNMNIEEDFLNFFRKASSSRGVADRALVGNGRGDCIFKGTHHSSKRWSFSQKVENLGCP